jgi:cell division protein FtsB
MKLTKKLLEIMMRLVTHPSVKYIVITVIGVLLVGVVGENSMLAHMRNVNRCHELEAEIDTYESRYRDDMRQIRMLNRNPKNMERIARQRYFMKHDDEDIFVLSDDVREPQSVASAPISEEPDDHDAAE